MFKDINEGIVYILKDIVKLIGLSIDLICLYEKEFNFQI